MIKSMNIRNATLQDLPYLYEVCHQTGYQGTDATGHISDRYLLGQIFMAPYVIHNPEWCWVVTNQGVPVGYLVTCPDTQVFCEWLEHTWLPKVRTIYPKQENPSFSDFEIIIRSILYKQAKAPEWLSDYPTHIHIDLLPDYQRKGIGRKLFDIFHEKCLEQNIKGVYIEVAKANESAMTFYQKIGYQVAEEYTTSIRFSRKFTLD